jgi:hypothetical protein
MAKRIAKTEVEKEAAQRRASEKRSATAHTNRVRRLRNAGWKLTPHPDPEKSHWMVLLPPSDQENSKEGREALRYYEGEKAKLAKSAAAGK